MAFCWILLLSGLVCADSQQFLNTTDVLDAIGVGSHTVTGAPSVVLQHAGGQAITTVERLSKVVILPVSAFFLVCVMVGNIISLKDPTAAVPVSASTTMVAVLMAFFLRWLINTGVITDESVSFFSSTLLNCFFLPVIIFQSGWALPVPSFLSQLEHILIFAILGTVLSTLIIGFSSYYLAVLGAHDVTSLRANMAFAALISACDPVATLATFTHLRIETTQPFLNVLLLGESMLNDAVAIVLFSVINNDYDEASNFGELIPLVFYELFGAIFFGVFVASLLVLCMRIADLPGQTTEETLFIFMSSFFCFAAASACGFSGIISNLFSGIIFGRYARMHLTTRGDEICSTYLRISGEFCDTCVFMICGTVTALIPGWDGITYGFLMLVLCLIARGIGMPVCAVICNGLKRAQDDPQLISGKMVYMMFHGGLRGGIALVLAIELDESWCEHRGTILSGTFFVMASLLLVMGSTTEIALDKLGMTPNDDPRHHSETFRHKPSSLLVFEEDYNRWPFKVAAKLNVMFKFLLVGEHAIPPNSNKKMSEPFLIPKRYSGCN